MNVIEEIKGLDIPHESYFRAVRYMTEEYSGIEPDAARELIKALTGLEITSSQVDDRYVVISLLYVVQEAIRLYNEEGDSPDPDRVIELAVAYTNRLVRGNAWMFVEDQPTETKVNKQERAEEIYKEMRGEDKNKIIKAFQRELDMSKSGARTYYYNMRNKFGDN